MSLPARPSARVAAFVFLIAAAASVAAFAATRPSMAPAPAVASSHREAPLISEDPAADNTDTYAFRSKDAPNALTVVANWNPAEDPAAGPMYYQFSPRVRYYINIDRNGDGVADIRYLARFNESQPTAFLRYGRQGYNVWKYSGKNASKLTQVGRNKLTPRNYVGPRTNADGPPTSQTAQCDAACYRREAASRVSTLSDGTKVFAGQRDDAFYADIGAAFDLVALRSGTGITGGGKDFFAGYGVHAIALQIPISTIDTPSHVVGVWASSDREQVLINKRTGKATKQWVQVSRLANPLFNELVNPTRMKDSYNALQPSSDARELGLVRTPILAALINKLYPGVLDAPETNRDDLVQVFLTGVPGLNYTGKHLADELRINLSTSPATGAENRMGVIGGDTAGFPNGRRLGDDVVDIAEQVVAGALTKNPKSGLVGDGVNGNDKPFLDVFPYEPDPSSGYTDSKGEQQPASAPGAPATPGVSTPVPGLIAVPATPTP